MEDIDLPDIEKPNSISNYKFGIFGKLKAKSHKGSGSSLFDHSLQAGRMALTVSETINVESKFREKLRISSFIGGIYHDLGKATAGFQEMLLNPSVKGWGKDKGGYRHEMISMILFLANSLNSKIWEKNKVILWSVYLSIIVHHKPFREKLTKIYPKIIRISQWPGGKAFEEMYKELLLNKKRLQDSWVKIISYIESDNWGKELIRIGWIPRSLSIPNTVSKAVEVFETFQSKNNIPGYSKGIIEQNKYQAQVSDTTSKFISYVRAAVTVGDHLSSGSYLFLPAFPFLKKYDLYTQFNPKPFQIKCRNIQGNLLLRAPTGSGKTEAAMSWLQTNQLTDQNRLSKVYFVLPYQASLNAMFNRITKWIDVKLGLVGLQHSRAAQILLKIIEDELYGGNPIKYFHGGKKKMMKYHDPWSQIKNIRTIERKLYTKLLLNDGYQRDQWSSPVSKQTNIAAMQINKLTRENFYPIKVTTPHQILRAVLQGRGWEINVQEFEEACFVFDEIHVYDAHLTGLILGMASVLKNEFKAKLMFMSASFPTFLIEKIRKYVDKDIPLLELDSDQLEDKKLLDKLRHIIKVSNRKVTDLCSDSNFIDIINKKSSVLIICNTVATAQKTFDLLNESSKIDDREVMLFHSRFTLEDRNKKEKLILKVEKSNLRIVVATQVVEVSLDIDFEFGIFEGAPLDAIVQRLGRVNRRGNRGPPSLNIILTQPEGDWDFVYNEKITKFSIQQLKKVSMQPITEMKLIELIDELYDEIGWDDTQKAEFTRAFNNTKFDKFFENALPGTFSNWIDKVILDRSTVDVLHPAHLEKYQKRLKNEPLKALDLLIPIRVYKKDYTQNKPSDPKVLNDSWNYDSNKGLSKIESDKK